jgi:hypothetical protein
MLSFSPLKRTRLLAALLLAAFAWGTTAELNHQHGFKVRSAQALLATTPDSLASESSSPQVGSEETSGTSSSSKTGAACLICQLQQNLSATLFSKPPGVGSTETQALNATATLVVQLSEYTANRHGRAPPTNL